jgi:DNA-binding GntR family transcriptional regulator
MFHRGASLMQDRNSGRRRGDSAKIVYEQLRKSIINLELPPGELLDEASLSERFMMSRSPIREALIRLSMEGLVQTLPNKNSLVAPMPIEDLPEYFDALSLTQRLVTRLAARLRTKENISELREKQEAFKSALLADDFSLMIETNREFHLKISEAAGNKHFHMLHSRLLDEGRRMLYLYFGSFQKGVPLSVGADHDLIIDAIENKDEELAEKYAEKHAKEVCDRFVRYLSDRKTEHFDIRKSFDKAP